MRHNLNLNGAAFRLRPVCDADASFILELRSNLTRNQFIHPTTSSIKDQLEWLSSYYERAGDYYFLVERIEGGSVEGVASIYNIDPSENCGEWGRWILRPGSFAAVESAWLIYRCAFEKLNLKEIYSRTIVENSSVVSFHDSCGISNRKILPAHFELGGKKFDAIEHRISKQEWSELEPWFEKLAIRIARRWKRDPISIA